MVLVLLSGSVQRTIGNAPRTLKSTAVEHVEHQSYRASADRRITPKRTKEQHNMESKGTPDAENTNNPPGMIPIIRMYSPDSTFSINFKFKGSA